MLIPRSPCISLEQESQEYTQVTQSQRAVWASGGFCCVRTTGVQLRSARSCGFFRAAFS